MSSGMTEEHLAAATGSVLGVVRQLIGALAPLPLDEMLDAVVTARKATEPGPDRAELLVQEQVLGATIMWRDNVRAIAQ